MTSQPKRLAAVTYECGTCHKRITFANGPEHEAIHQAAYEREDSRIRSGLVIR